MYYLILSLTLLVYLKSSTESSRILGVFPSSGYSQYLLAEPLMIELAEKGHEVTVISAFETRNATNLRSITVPMPVDKEESDSLYKLQDLNIFRNLEAFNELTLACTENILKDTKVQSLLNSNKSFDLVIVETFNNEGHLAFAKHFKAHLVLFSSQALSQWNAELVGNINLPSYLPTPFSRSVPSMNFMERFINTMAMWYDKYLKIFYHYPAQQALINKYFPVKYRLEDIMYNASLMLSCSHVSTSGSISLTPSVIEVGGLHIKTNELPHNFKSFLDSANEGAILFSMGSNLRSSSFSKETIREIVNMIANLQYKVIWKFEDPDLENKPSNLLISKWVPQSDILAHPNIIAFISHCGMGGTTEAVYHGVPVIGIPVFGDQFANVLRLVRMEMAVELPFKQLSGNVLQEAIQEVIHNKKYRENAKTRSNVMRDRVLKPLDEAVYWVEYVIKHDGAHYLKSSLSDLAWYQLYLVDVVLAIAVIPYVIFILVRLVGKLLT